MKGGVDYMDMSGVDDDDDMDEDGEDDVDSDDEYDHVERVFDIQTEPCAASHKIINRN